MNTLSQIFLTEDKVTSQNQKTAYNNENDWRRNNGNVHMATNQPEQSSKDFFSATILVTDNESDSRHALTSLLREQGFSVVEASNDTEAFRYLACQSFDLVLIDLNLPSPHVTRVMEQTTRLQPDCGVVVVSGEHSFSSVSRALRRGALDYIRKPFDPEELLTTIEGVLGKRSLIKSHEAIQTRLEKSEALHRYIVNSSPDIVFMLDAAGHIC